MNYYFFDQLTRWLERRGMDYTRPMQTNPQAADLHLRWVAPLPLIGKVTNDLAFWDFDRLAIEPEHQAYALEQANLAQLTLVEADFARKRWLRLHLPSAITVAVSARRFSAECIKLVEQPFFAWTGGYACSMILLNPRGYSIIHQRTWPRSSLPPKMAINFIQTMLKTLDS